LIRSDQDQTYSYLVEGPTSTNMTLKPMFTRRKILMRSLSMLRQRLRITRKTRRKHKQKKKKIISYYTAPKPLHHNTARTTPQQNEQKVLRKCLVPLQKFLVLVLVC